MRSKKKKKTIIPFTPTHTGTKNAKKNNTRKNKAKINLKKTNVTKNPTNNRVEKHTCKKQEYEHSFSDRKADSK